MKTSCLLCCSFAAASLAIFSVANASADIISDLASATIIEEFLFDDAAGTTIADTVNSANAAHPFSSDSDTTGVLTNGLGQLDASLKDNTGFGTNFIDIDDITEGRILLGMELTWDFSTSVFDAGEIDEIRLTLTNNPPNGSQITAQMEIQRNSLTELELNSSATGGDNFSSTSILNFTQPTNFHMLLDVNLDTDMYTAYYSDDAGASYSSLGTGGINPTRIGAAVRMVLNNDLSDDNILIDRVFLAVAVPEPSTFLLACLSVPLFAGRRKISC